MENNLEVYSDRKYKRLKVVKTKFNSRTILDLDNRFIIVGEIKGMIEIYETHSLRKIAMAKLNEFPEADIHEMRKMSNFHEIGIAT